MPAFTSPPHPPYVAVIFSSIRTPQEGDGYETMAAELERLAAMQEGYLGFESARNEDGFGIAISYWRDEESAKTWKNVSEHMGAQKRGQEKWYASYHVHIANVTRAYQFARDDVS